MVPLMVVASRAEGPAIRGRMPTTAMKMIAIRPTQACLQHDMTQHSTAVESKPLGSVFAAKQQYVCLLAAATPTTQLPQLHYSIDPACC